MATYPQEVDIPEAQLVPIEENIYPQEVDILETQFMPVEENIDSIKTDELTPKLPESKLAENAENDTTLKKRRHSEDEYEDDGKTCPICLDNWTNFGDHRVCALKCGHLFGLNCIKRWFTYQRKKNCPSCKKKAIRSDIRYIYTKKLIALDTSELETLKDQLNEVSHEKTKIQIELAHSVAREHLLKLKVQDLTKKIDYLNSTVEVQKSLGNSQININNSNNIRLFMDKSLEICKASGCRVLDTFTKMDIIAASIQSPNQLFSGFGVRKINITTYKPTSFIPLHSKSIRDISFHPENPWLLSVSLDKNVKIVDITSNNTICLNAGDAPLWSCCWDIDNTNMLYVGKQQGSVTKLDMRKIKEPVCHFEVPGDMSPVVSVASLSSKSGYLPQGGVICCKLNSLWVFGNEFEQQKGYPLLMEGPFISMKYNNCKNQLLISTRSNSKYPYTRHHICYIENGPCDNLFCHTALSFTGSSTQKFLSRSCLIPHKNDCYVAAHQESNKTVCFWNINTEQKACSIPARNPVLDLCSFSVNGNTFVTTLTEKKMEFFKFVQL